MRGDALASGGTSATFATPTSKPEDPIDFKWNIGAHEAEEKPDSDESWQATQSLLNSARHQGIIAALKPLNDRVLLRRYEETDGKDVQIADAFKGKSNRGTVLAVGPSVTSLSEGDRVLFGEYSAEDITIDGEELVLISVHDCRLKLS